MQIVVTGACSRLGQALLRAIAARGSLAGADGAIPIRRLIAVDRTQPAALFVDERIEYVRGDYELPRFLARMMGTGTGGAFHLSALGAGAAPAGDVPSLDEALQRGFDTTRALLDASRLQATPPRFVLASTLEARQAQGKLPASPEGAHAAMCELLLAEAARGGFLDLRCVRLPCIVGNASRAAEIALDETLARIAADPAAEPASARTQMPVLLASEAAGMLIEAYERTASGGAPGAVEEVAGRVRTLAELAGERGQGSSIGCE